MESKKKSREKSPRRKSPRMKSPRRKSPRRKSPRRKSPRRTLKDGVNFSKYLIPTWAAASLSYVDTPKDDLHVYNPTLDSTLSATSLSFGGTPKNDLQMYMTPLGPKLSYTSVSPIAVQLKQSETDNFEYELYLETQKKKFGDTLKIADADYEVEDIYDINPLYQVIVLKDITTILDRGFIGGQTSDVDYRIKTNPNYFFKLFDASGSSIIEIREDNKEKEIIRISNALDKARLLHESFPDNFYEYEPFIILVDHPDGFKSLGGITKTIDGVTLSHYINNELLPELKSLSTRAEIITKFNEFMFGEYRQMRDINIKSLDKLKYIHPDLHTRNVIRKDNGTYTFIDLEPHGLLVDIEGWNGISNLIYQYNRVSMYVCTFISGDVNQILKSKGFYPILPAKYQKPLSEILIRMKYYPGSYDSDYNNAYIDTDFKLNLEDYVLFKVQWIELLKLNDNINIIFNGDTGDILNEFIHDMKAYNIKIKNVTLYMSDNGLPKIVDEVYFYDNIESLTMYAEQTSRIDNIPKNSLKSIKKIIISSTNSIIDIDNFLEKLINVEYLEIDRYEDIYSTFKKLKHLELEGVHDFPDVISNIPSLEILHITSGNSARIPTNIEILVNLRELDMKNMHNIVSLPESIGKLKNLQKLNLESLQGLNSLPESIGYLVNLRELSMINIDNIVSLPKSIGNLENLQKLTLSILQGLNSLPESIGNLKNLQELKIYSLEGLNSLPESIGYLVNLRELYMGGIDNIVSLPKSIGNLENLQKLTLLFLQGLNSLPESIGNLENLQELKLYSLKGLNSLPESIGNLKNLRYLYLTSLQGLNSLPESIGNLKNLRYLYLTSLQGLNSLPESIGNIKNLQLLSINYSMPLPDSLKKLVKLKITYDY